MSALVSLCSVPSYVQNKQFYSTNNLSKIATVVPQMSLSSSISNQQERIASEQLKPLNGLEEVCKWIEDHGLKRAAVTNAPRPNAELIISMLGLSDFFELLIIGSECERAKPFPDPYLKALQELGVSPKHAFVFEDSISGIKAGVAAGMPVVGLGLRNPEKLLSEAGATFVIKDFNDSKLWTALEELVTEIHA